MAVTSMANSSITNYNKFNRMDKDSALQAQVSGTTGSPTVGTDGSATIYSFTGSGSITVSRAGFAELLVIGGGGGGGVRFGAGGGAGGHLSVASAYLPAGTHTVTVGAGGAFGIEQDNEGVPGNNGFVSRIGDYFSPGGGAGASNAYNNTAQRYGLRGLNGASGGGAGGNTSGVGSFQPGGSGFSTLGTDGGDANANAGGGGGGASTAGANAGFRAGGDGGDGESSSITGTAVTRAGGGGGTGDALGVGTGGTGGGGTGATSGTAGSGTANTGSGGGGADSGVGGSGGSGIVIVRVG